jgi:release factor glutamine methyltransferase
MKLGALHLAARARLAQAGIADAALDSRLIVEHFTGTGRTDAIARPEQEISAAAGDAVEDALRRRLAGEPVHRILGYREFYGLRLSLSAETLEPRPDTETLVDAVLPFVRATAVREGRCRILDLGTGTGAIALALLHCEPAAEAVAVDISQGALAMAARNAAELGLSARFTAKKSDWFAEISGRYHAIVSNPPYIPAKDIGALEREVRDHDPVRALDGGADGLDAYRPIAAGAATHLEHGGIVALEIGSTQAAEVAQLFASEGFVLSDSRRDLAGNQRALVFRVKE